MQIIQRPTDRDVWKYGFGKLSCLRDAYVGRPPVKSAGYYPVGSDCVLYHAYWDGTADDHSPVGTNDGVVTGASFGE